MYPDDVREYMIDEAFESAECQYCKYYCNGYCEKIFCNVDYDDYCDAYRQAEE